MAYISRILDNDLVKVAGQLKHSLVGADALCIATAFFSVSGYKAMAEELNRLDDVRILIGAPKSVGGLNRGAAQAQSFEWTADGHLTPMQTLFVRSEAKACAEWMRRDSVSARTIRGGGLMHGKLYLSGIGDNPIGGIVGSSNFSAPGLGAGGRDNLELNVAIEDRFVLGELQRWFDRLWNDDARTRDVKTAIVAELERAARNYSPEMIYYKTLYEIFKDRLDAFGDDGWVQDTLSGSSIWKSLYEFQRDGALSVIQQLKALGGCILADSVGLGKTYTALAVIKYFSTLNEKTLVLCPRRLVQNWDRFRFDHTDNAFPEDKFHYEIMSHTDLGRESGQSWNGRDLDTFNWGAYDLIVLDESHNFRNDKSKRYRALMESAIKGGANPKILMLTATPVNMALSDIGNQIRLITADDDRALSEQLEIDSVDTALKLADARFREWARSEGRRKDELIRQLGGGFMRVITSASIARSRAHIKRVYGRDVPGFPKRAPVEDLNPNTIIDDDEGSFAFYDKVAGELGELKLAVYNPTAYFEDWAKEGQRINSERNLVAMMRVNLMKRLESSAHALTLTVERMIDKIDQALDKADAYEKGGEIALSLIAVAGVDMGDFGEDEESENAERALETVSGDYPFGRMNIVEWREAMRADRDLLRIIMEEIKTVRLDADGKLGLFKEQALDLVGIESETRRKLLVFTAYKDTAVYLHDALRADARFENMRTAVIYGGSVGSDFERVLDRFSPEARGKSDMGDGIDLLIATDCVSEGQNLQDCGVTLNYDIHWNPVRLFQRFGRVDRIGSPHEYVRMINYWPPKGIDNYLDMETRVRARMALADAAGTAADNVLEDDAGILENYRMNQIRAMQDNVTDIEDLEDTPTIADFSMQFFIDQLRRYLEKNSRELESIPKGVYAISDYDGVGCKARVVFCLRREHDGVVRSASSAPPPYYLVSVFLDGSGRMEISCDRAYNALRLIMNASAGRSAPDNDLYDVMDIETDNGQNMNEYSEALRFAIEDSIERSERAAIRSISRESGARTALLPSSCADGMAAFELITWFIIRPARDDGGLDDGLDQISDG